MSTLTYALTTQATGIYPGGYQTAVTVKNTGTGIAYLSEATAFTPASGFPLNPGSSMQWDAQRPLFALSDTTTTILVLDNTGALFDASAVANQILGQGIADQIANKLTLVGVPPIDAQSVFVNQVFTTNVPIRINLGDLHKYQSLQIAVREYATLGSIGVLPTVRPIQLQWFTGPTAQDTLLTEDTFYINDDNDLAGYATFRVPVKAATAYLIIGSNGVTHDVQLAVIGSYKTINSASYENFTDYFQPIAGDAIAGATSAHYVALQFNQMAANTTRKLAVPSKSGPATINVDSGNDCGIFLLSAAPANVAPVFANMTLAGVSNRSDKIILPRVPLYLQVDARANGVGYIRCTITFDE